MNFDTQLFSIRDSPSIPSDDMTVRTFLIATKSFDNESLATYTSPNPLLLTPPFLPLPFTQTILKRIAVARHRFCPQQKK